MTVKLIFFFKQKTAYEVLRSLVGSEMCIGDSSTLAARVEAGRAHGGKPARLAGPWEETLPRKAYVDRVERAKEHIRAGDVFQVVLSRRWSACLLYTSDAADELPCVDLGGRRITKKNNIMTYHIN
mgnify:CR=1 FL=1